MNKGKENNTLIFLHIPKTAGSTFHDILDKNYDPEGIFTLDGLDPPRSVAEFKEMTGPKRSSFDLVKGHMLFGLHKFIPTSCTYITFLRDPVERVVSYYYYVCRFPDHYLHDQVVGGKMSLKQFVESGITTEINDFQVKLLAGDESALHSRQYDDRLVESARKNIESDFSVVGFAEYFDESLLLMKYRLGWQFVPYYERLNVTATRAKIDMLGQDIIQSIKYKNVLDCALYEWALSRFRNSLQEAGISQGKVNRFRRLNRMYTMLRLRKVYLLYGKFKNHVLKLKRIQREKKDEC